MQSLPDLYPNIKKEVKLKISCDKDSYDPNGCTGPALFNIEFIEATLNQHSLKSIERNRIDFENTIAQLIETPSSKVVLASLFIEKSIPILLNSYDFHNEDTHIERSLLGSILSWINDTNYMYPPSKRMFTNLLDSLGSIAEIRCDETNQFVLETAINYPKIIEYMAPRLLPSNTSTQCFLNMYQLIEQKLTKTPPQVSFVLLSKFDVSLWFRNASHEQCLSLIQVLGNALNSFGNKPKDEYLMVFGLYRKHLQYALIFRFPQYLPDVFNILLKRMKEQSISPCLWNDVLLSFGFFITQEDVDLSHFYLELKKYSNNQPLFTANELFDILSLMSTHLSEAYREISVEFLDHFKIYIQQYLTLISTLSFCWLNANSRMPPCDILNVWRPFYDNWNAEIDMQSIPFELLTATKVQSIGQVIVRVIKLKSYFFESNNTSHSFLLGLLKQICLLSDTDINDEDWLLKHKYYANSISYLLKDLSSGDNELVTKYPLEIRNFITKCFEDLRPAFQSDIESSERINLFNQLLNSLNDISNEDIRRIVSEQYAMCFNFENPNIICDLIQSTCQTVKHIPSFLSLNETYIYNYFRVEGNISNLLVIFEIPNNTEDFMVGCVTKNASLTLTIHFLSKLVAIEDTKRFVSGLMNWSSQLRPNADDESKVLLLWFKVLTISESLVDNEEESIELIHSIHKFCKNLFDVVEESVYQGFLSFMRTNRKSFSERCTVLILCLSLHGIKHLNDCISRTSPLNAELNTVYKSALNKLQSLKKNKSFVELLPLIENMGSVLDRSESTVESTQLIKQSLMAFYSDNSCLTAII
ncbi:unnamed protein product [Medioppia subpectinata]|uniref:Epg5-like central TPR repeats domain-containing protein n=1 Tax=Medioppia subpectinata TaxID=1979941 RepID=A0A7R9PY25_9ACAR|nr:unnamed protein product [Medioppia subpectinata]CAG2105434.1 unnamed protein product [Medioppia subpectinata]